ncbi:MAG: MiaB/RimO family radical SAM methylthiotransferase [Myxococcota bacterium]
MYRVSFCTLGCRVNQAETRRIMENIETEVELVEFGQDCDLTVVNSCVVTGQAERTTRKMVNRARKYSPDGKIIIMGCYVDAHELVKAIKPSPDLYFVKKEQKDSISKMIREFADPHSGCESQLRKTSGDKLPSFAPSSTRPPLLVQNGCNKRCAYCIIPLARGRAVSKPLGDILDDYRRLLDCGYREIVLTGINIGSWGYDLDPDFSISTLLEELLKLTPKKHRIRTGSLEPESLDDAFFDLISEPGIAPHLHLPLQATHQEILNRMNRPFPLEKYQLLLEKARKACPDIAVGSDLICGFPGESKEHFEKGLKLVEEMAFSYLHVFPFSARAGTEAATFKQLKPEVVKERAARMRKLGMAMKTQYLDSFIGKKVKVAVETKVGDNFFRGTSGQFFNVHFGSSGTEPSLGELVEVKLEIHNSRSFEGQYQW